MTDLNEKLKLVAEYDGYEVLETGTVTLGQLKKNQTIIPLCDYDSDYQRQIPVWQKVVAAMRETIDGYNPKGISEHDFKIMQFDTDYSEQINNGTPLESFEILVQAIQFINNLKQK